MQPGAQPVDLGLVEVIEAGDLTDEHYGRRVSFPGDDGERTHGVLTKVGGSLHEGHTCLVVGGMHHVPFDTPVSVVLQTAAEVRAARLAAEVEQ